jgi:Protein of unknown function (DUF3892)
VEVAWRNPDNGKTGQSTVAEMVAFIENKNGKAAVTDGRGVDATSKHIRSHADGVWTDNLLLLPRY